MHAIMWVNDPKKINNCSCVFPDAIYYIKVTDGIKSPISRVEFNSKGKRTQSKWETIKEWNRVLSEMQLIFPKDVEFIYFNKEQYDFVSNAISETTKRLSSKDIILLTDYDNAKGKNISYKSNPDDNIRLMSEIFSEVVATNKAYRGKRFKESESLSKTKLSNTKSVVKHDKINGEDILVKTKPTDMLSDMQIVCNKLGFDLVIENDIARIQTVSGDWKFNYIHRPIILEGREYKEGGTGQFEIVRDSILAPLGAIRFIAQTNYERVLEMDELFKNLS